MEKSNNFTYWESALKDLNNSKLMEMNMGELSTLSYLFLDKLIHVVSVISRHIKSAAIMAFGVTDKEPEPEVSFLNDGVLHCSVLIHDWDILPEKLKIFADLVGEHLCDGKIEVDSDGTYLYWDVHFLSSEMKAHGIKGLFN